MVENIGEQKGRPKLSESLVWWQRELLESGKARYIPVVIDVTLDEISDPEPCPLCGSPTVKAWWRHSVVTDDQTLILGTEKMPGYQCENQRTCGVVYLSNEGTIEFETRIIDILNKQGYAKEAGRFMEDLSKSKELLQNVQTTTSISGNS